MTETKISFKPVKCKESDLQTLSPINGYVYFTTDTQKIYCANENKFLPMGGNSGIYYGQREFAENEKNTDETDFIFNMDDEEIEGDQIPNVQDLILNIPDGGFYRVIDVYGKLITGRRLLVSGVGSGDGTGSGGAGSQKPLITPSFLGSYYFKLDELEEMKIKFTCSSPLDDGRNYIAGIKYYFGQQDNPEESVNYKFGEEIAFDISKYLNNFDTASRNTLQIEVIDAYGNKSKKQSFFFYLIQLSLFTDVSPISKIVKGDNQTFLFPCKPQGGTGLENLFIDFRLSPIDNPSQVVYTEQKFIKDVNTNYPFNVVFDNLIDKDGNPAVKHGVYLATIQFGGQVPLTGRIISSQIKSAQVAYYDREIGTHLIATDFQETEIMQYMPYTLKYMIVDESSSLNIVNPLIYYGINYSTEAVKLGDVGEWDHTFTSPGAYDIAIQYKGSKTQLGTLKVNTYSGDIPTIDANSAEFYLTSIGKSNTQADKDVWESKGHKAVFENFLWGNENGWITNERNETALKITNGAKLEIPTYHPFANNATTTGLTIELDFMFSGVLDYSKPLIHCLSKYTIDGVENVQTGFNITGQKATLNSAYYKATVMEIKGEENEDGSINEQDMALQAFTQYFNEDTRIHLTYVIDRVPDWSLVGNNFYFVYTYLNGVLSGIMRLDVDAQNKKADSFVDYLNTPSHMVFDSTYGDIYLYNIRVYRNALDTRTVIKNYIADLTDIEKKVSLNRDNDIFTADGYINIKAIQDLSYSCGVPYVLFNGGNSMNKKFKDAFAFDDTYALPTTKSDYRFMSMKMYDVDEKTGNTYLAIDVPIEAQNQENKEEIIEKFDNLVEGTSYLPKRGVQVYGQGTSSMVYPVKNLRLKFVQEEDYPQVYEGACPTEIVCFKADFMESSSAHNTCTGNLIYDIYQDLNLKTPPQAFKINNQGKEGITQHDIVTAIKGFPIVCFYAPGDSTDYQYIGRYNFNLDKATPEPFGFIPQKVYTGETVTDDLGRVRQVVDVCGLKTEEVKGKTVLPLDSEGKEVERDIVQCWEILNNDNGSPTKFLKLQDFNTFDESLTTITPKGDKYTWMEYYEDRYPDAIVSGGKYLLGDTEEDEYEHYEEDLNNGLFRMAKWINSTAIDEVTGQMFDTPVYYQTLDRSWNREKTYYTANGEVKPITVTQGVSYHQDNNLAETKLSSLTINKDVFVSKVGDGQFDSYAFLYDGYWYLDGELVSLTDYGISYTGSPQAGSAFTIVYFESNNWSNTLYEQFDSDNEGYRLSKFKTEFTQYFDMNFSLFYYVMTMVLLMMDSRAKNMMLASWDQQIWYPIFYDMDTMLGLNNTGFNKFSFDTEDDPADKVFNGFDSVLWNNFRECFPNQIADFYAKMRGKMTLEKMLTTYNEKGTDAWNEAFCSADAYYKYERPYKEGYYDGKEGIWINPGQISYLYAAQGRRSNHRAWWLSNRLNYLDSKYIPTTYGNEKPSQATTFSFRAYALPEQKSTAKAEACVAQTPPNHKFNLTALNNSYQSIFIGNIVYGPEYTKAGQTVTLGPTEVKHEVESYILNPQLISNLGDLSDKYIGSLTFPGVQTRLTELNFGRSSRSHPNSYTAYYNKLLSALNIGSTCPYLQKVNIARCTGLKTVSFTECPRLQVLDAEGSELTNINFPANSILKEIYLPNTLQSLTLTNQPYLTTIQFDSTAKSLTSINLDNVPNYDSYELVKQVFSTETAKSFYLTNVNWEITDEQNAMENGKLVGIDILDTLLSDKAYTISTDYKKMHSLTGTITVNIPGIAVNEYEIYNKYKSLFPGLEIKFGEKVENIEKAYNLTFMTADDETGIVFYNVKAPKDKSLTLQQLTSAQGPNGEAMGIPDRDATDSHNYEFTGYWFDQTGKYYRTDKAEEDKPGAIDFNSFKDYSSDMTFYPEYRETDKYYEVKFYDANGKILLQDGEETWSVKYNQIYDGPIKNFLYKDDSGLADNLRYTFLGWSGIDYGDRDVINAEYIDLGTYRIKNSITLYPHFKIQDVHDEATSMEYFQIKDGVISLKEEYLGVLQGKITLPSDSRVVAIGTMSTREKPAQFTHVYTLNDNTAYAVNSSAFSYARQLKVIELPQTITEIKSSAFTQCNNLVSINLNDNITTIENSAFSYCTQLQLNSLPSNLKTLGSAAFQLAGPGIKITSLPSELEVIPSWAFGSCVNVKITNFGSNDGTSKLREIGANAFSQAGTGTEGAVMKDIYINGSVIIIGERAFSGYGAGVLECVYFARSPENMEYGQTFSGMGFPKELEWGTLTE